MTQPLEKLLLAADNHGEDSGETDHTVGDMQDLQRRTWAIMQLLWSSEVDDLMSTGARGEFEADDVVTDIQRQLIEMESAVTAAGYTFVETENGIYWECAAEASENFYDRADAVEAAYYNLHAATTIDPEA